MRKQHGCSTDQSINQPIEEQTNNQSINRSINQSINRSKNRQTINQSINQSTDQRTNNQSINQSINRSKNKQSIKPSINPSIHQLTVATVVIRIALPRHGDAATVIAAEFRRFTRDIGTICLVWKIATIIITVTLPPCRDAASGGALELVRGTGWRGAVLLIRICIKPPDQTIRSQNVNVAEENDRSAEVLPTYCRGSHRRRHRPSATWCSAHWRRQSPCWSDTAAELALERWPRTTSRPLQSSFHTDTSTQISAPSWYLKTRKKYWRYINNQSIDQSIRSTTLIKTAYFPEKWIKLREKMNDWVRN